MRSIQKPSKLVLLITYVIMVSSLAWFGQAAAAEAASVAELYAIEPEPLTVGQCVQCHVAHFNWLKANGGLHRFDCRQCHEVFHAYNPKKGNWEELMPKCSNCHELPHGEEFTNCLTCHVNPHTPRLVPMSEELTSSCGVCHKSPAQQLNEFPSKHTQQGCNACHTKHGFIPSCMECHEPHLPGQTMEVCLSCHQVHKPLQITLSPDSSTETCSACHDAVYAKWSASQSKHGKVNCSRCHTAHGKIPACTQCHAAPHDKGMLERFTSCLDCHLDPHDPPVK